MYSWYLKLLELQWIYDNVTDPLDLFDYYITFTATNSNYSESKNDAITFSYDSIFLKLQWK